jgi:tetratricopeptide (TPR) repeat protein
MQLLQRKAYSAAAQSFQSLVDTFPAERALLDRARVYLELCRRESARPHPAEAASLEERLTLATAAFNDGDDARARSLLEGVLRQSPQQDLALYLLAAMAARRGDRDEALGHLARAVDASPDAAAQARLDPDFDDLHDDERFAALTSPPQAPVPGAPPARRPRRGRADK